VARLNRLFSRAVDGFIANSQAGAAAYAAAGYPSDRIAVVPNGIDTDAFFRDETARRRLRSEWQIGEADVLIGMVGRLDRRKNYETAVEAAARVARGNAAVRFVHVGGGDARYRAELQALAADLGVGDRFSWRDHSERAGEVFSALDVFVIPSTTEGFSNALAEAMACELPVVATDVGDSRFIVGDEGFTTPPGDDVALAATLADLSRPGAMELRRDLGRRARQRVVELFGIERMVGDTASHLERIAKLRRQ
jgi:glycosyltransferase involved in cell wall biosynthesis